MHPADEIRGSINSHLQGKRLVLAITGSIAAVETIHLARELICHGADVIPVMTPAATRIIHPDSLWFATGHQPICELTGDTEHVRYCGKVTDPVDAVLVCPCTANTLSKIALGIDDTPVTTFVSTAIGSQLPVIIVPAMHISMYDHRIVQENLTTCKQQGIMVIEPRRVKNKAKLADQEMIIASVIQKLGSKTLESQNILVIGGGTAEPVDDVRMLTNRSSGKMAVALAKQAFFKGAKLTFWYGTSSEQVPSYVPCQRFTSLHDLQKSIKSSKLSAYTAIIVCAALADFIPEKQQGKVSSEKKQLVVTCSKAPKILPVLQKKAAHAKIIAFKLEAKKSLVKQKATLLQEKYDLFAVIGNVTDALGDDASTIWIVDKKGSCIKKTGEKNEIADHILQLLE